ncbi:MAG TPA: MMPL family transporter [Nocardioides sp.]|uniref:MMPL family transporter n=1 Tax=Nocardioides sp. TaxID=35761 RepID=UPI002ED9B479
MFKPRFTRASIAHPRAVIGGWLLLAVILAPLAVLMPHALQAGGFSDERGDAARGESLAREHFGDPRTTAAIVIDARGGQVDDSTIERVARAAAGVAGVETTVDYRDLPALRSQDASTAVVIANFRTGNTATQNAIPELRERARDAVGTARVAVHVTGQAALDYDLNIASERDAVHAELIAFPLLVVVLLLVYRAVGATLITLLIAGISLGVARAAGFLLGQWLDISNLYTTGVSLIGLAVAVDYSLFIIKRFREHLDAGLTPAEAATVASRTAGHAVRFGGMAVIVALAALYLARNMVFSSIATAGIIVTLTAIALTTTFLPAVLTLLGRRTFWLPLPSRRTRDRGDAAVSWAIRWRLPILAVLVAALQLLAVPLLGLTLQVPVASASILPPGTDSRAGLEALNSKLDSEALFPLQVIVSGSSPQGVLAHAASVAETAAANPLVARADGPGEGTAEQAAQLALSGELRQQGTVVAAQDGTTTLARVLVVSRHAPDSDQTHELVDQLRAASSAPGVTTVVTGATAIGSDFDAMVTTSIPWIVLSVVVLTIALLGLAFRSVWIPILALGLNGLVVGASLGFLTALWKVVTDENINSVTPIVMFAIMFGLSMDYMVVMASRMKEAYVEYGDHDRAITEGGRRTAGLVTSAAVIMIAVFLSFLVAEISIVRQLGIGLAVAVFLDAAIIRPFLMPATLSLAGPRIWGRTAAAPDPVAPDAQPNGEPELESSGSSR